MGDEFISYASGAAWPMPVDQTVESARFYKKGASIAEKHRDIATQLGRIRNVREGLGLGTYSVNKLSEKLEKSYDKATASYWRGGLRDPIWRCLSTPNRPGFVFSMVADQLNEPCAELLTPSARRLLRTLTSLSEALETERQMLGQYEQVFAASEAARQSASPASPNSEWAALDQAKRNCLALQTDTSSFVEEMREAVDRARTNVRREKKHHGKRELINGCLYGGAAVLAIIGLLVSGAWVVAVVGIVALAVTILTRCVSLASIRGFDREKGWKAVDDLLDQTKEFINSEEESMRVALNNRFSLAQLEQDRLHWEQGQKALARTDRMLADIGSLRQDVGTLQQDMGSVKRDVSTLKEGVGTLTQDVSTLKEGVGTLTQDVSTLKEGVGTLTQDVSTLKEGVGTLTQDVSTLKEGVGTLTQDVSTLKEGVGALTQDVGTLKQGIGTLSEGVGTLTQDVGTLRQDVGALQRGFVSLSGDFRDMRNMILFDSASRRGMPPNFGQASAGASPRTPMERATSLDTVQASRTSRLVQSQRDSM